MLGFLAILSFPVEKFVLNLFKLIRRMKFLYIFLLLCISNIISAQDEYNKIEKENPPTPIYSKSDSIDVSEKKQDEPLESDNSKAYKGMSDFKRNVRIGGAFNLGSFLYSDPSYEGQLFFVMVSPQLTYLMSEYFEGGLTTSYSYTGSFGDISSHSISAGPVLRAYPIPEIFLQVEGVGFYNTTSVKGSDSRSIVKFNAFAGGGVVTRFSQTSYLITGVKINLIKNELTYNQIVPTAFTSIHFGLW